jgi:hypothetical protein
MNRKQNKIIFYRTESIKVEFEVHLKDGTFWLTQKIREYELYKAKQDKNHIFDFNREVKRLEGKR